MGILEFHSDGGPGITLEMNLVGVEGVFWFSLLLFGRNIPRS